MFFFFFTGDLYTRWISLDTAGKDGSEQADSRGADRWIRDTVDRISVATTKGELGHILAREVSGYSPFDLQVIGGRLNFEIDRLPSPYREKIRPFFRQQIFAAHHRLLAMERTGAFHSINDAIDLEKVGKYWAMVPDGCSEWHDESERNPRFRNPKNRLFYYLIAAFTMFVLDEPGHPVGMPFPGGFTVEQRKSGYYCLIRDKEKEIPWSICNFCPAKQTEEF